MSLQKPQNSNYIVTYISHCYKRINIAKKGRAQ